MTSQFRPFFGLGRLRRAVVVFAAAPVLTLAMLVSPVSTTVALATPVPSGCANEFNTLCTFRDAGYMGTRWLFHNTANQQCCFWWYVGNTPNDQISSLYNYSLHSQFAYVAKNCPADDQWTWIEFAQGAPNLANNSWPHGTSMNDSISAWAFGPDAQRSPAFPPHGSRMFGGC